MRFFLGMSIFNSKLFITYYVTNVFKKQNKKPNQYIIPFKYYILYRLDYKLVKI